MGPDGPREAIEQGIARLGCEIRERADGVLCVDCPTHEAKCRLLDLLAWRDARYDPRIRRIAVHVAEQTASDHAHKVDSRELAARLHAHVCSRVRFLGEGAETFQSSWQTLRSGVGDCDDSARALLALARSVAIPARLVVFDRGSAYPRGDLEPNHATVQLSPDAGRTWLYAEPSLGPGVKLGEHPIAAARRLKRQRSELGQQLGDLGGFGDATARPIILAAWQAAAGRPPSTFEAQITQAIARYETSYGKWDGPCSTSHNWGAIITARGSPDGCEHADTNQDGTKFFQTFRVYPDDTAGAADLVKELLRRPMTRAALAKGSSVFDVSAAMYNESYFGQTCPKATAEYGPSAAKESAWSNAQHKPTSNAGRACDAEAIANHAIRVHTIATQIAAALGEAPPALGSLPPSRTTIALLVLAAGGAAFAVARSQRWI